MHRGSESNQNFQVNKPSQISPHEVTIQYNTNFICQLPMGAFQRQILIVQVIKKKQTNQKKKLKNCQ